MVVDTLDYCIVATTFLCCLWMYYRRQKVNDAFKNLPLLPSDSLIYGNLAKFNDRAGEEFHRSLGSAYGPAFIFHGAFNQRVLCISDPKALYTVLIKEEAVFEETARFFQTNLASFGPGLLSTWGDWHRKQRKMLNPAFSVKHMHDLIPTFYSVIHRLRDAMTAQVKGGAREIDVLKWMSRTALELIGQGGLGYSFDPLVEDMHNDYGIALKSYLPALGAAYVFTFVMPYVYNLAPVWLRKTVVNAISYKPIADIKKSVNDMHRHSSQIYQLKKGSLQKGDEQLMKEAGGGKDIMSILMSANMQASEVDRIPEEEVLAQMSTLTFAATDTTSNALSRILWTLCRHPDIQEKLRTEILAANAGEELTYEQLNKLPFLDAVCRETLRVYSPVTNIDRVANADTVLPLLEPILGTDGKTMTEIHVPKGTEVMIGILSCNTSKALWGEDAHEWKPERWLSALPETVTKASVPGVYAKLMTFAGGRRACIGFKFSEMEMKVALSVLLSNFKFELPETTIIWNAAVVWFPSVEKDGKPAMPLKVSSLRQL